MSGGGKKVEVKLLENRKVRQVTFSKRRKGLFKKAMQLSLLCDAQISLTIRSGLGKVYRLESHGEPLNVEGIQAEVFLTNNDYDRVFGGGGGEEDAQVHQSFSASSSLPSFSPSTPAMDISGPRQIPGPNLSIAMAQQRMTRRQRTSPYPLQTRHGRAKPLQYSSVHKSQTMVEHVSSPLGRHVRFNETREPPIRPIHSSQSEIPIKMEDDWNHDFVQPPPPNPTFALDSGQPMGQPVLQSPDGEPMIGMLKASHSDFDIMVQDYHSTQSPQMDLPSSTDQFENFGIFGETVPDPGDVE